MKPVLIGLFPSTRHAADAIDNLANAGISDKHISIVAQESIQDSDVVLNAKTKMVDGLAIGTGAGAASGAALAALVTAGTIGLAPTGGFSIIATGPIAAAIAGASLGGVAGGTLGAAIGSAVPEEDVAEIEHAVERGAVLVFAEYDDEPTRDLILESYDRSDADRIIAA